VNRRLQSAFEKLKSSLSLYEIKEKASIVSGVIVLSKLFGARERSLCTQFFCIWKLWDTLRVQRDKELAAKDEQISKLNHQKLKAPAPQDIPPERMELRSARFVQNKENNTFAEASFRGNKAEPLAKADINTNKESFVDPAPVIKKNPALVETQQEKAKSPNQVLYERLKALYE